MGLEPTTENPVDLNDADPNKGVDAAKKLLAENEIEQTEENIFIAAACKQKGIDFLLGNVEINGVRKHSLMPKKLLRQVAMVLILYLLMIKFIM